MEILIPIIILLVTAIVCAVLLTVASVFFAVEENEKYEPIRECLPGANCGACGYSGCDSYAKALAEGEETNPSLCIPGGDGTAKGVAAVLGTEAADVVERVAYVACNGACRPEEKKYIYTGPRTCHAANMSFSGDRFCTFACLGYGDCMRSCPREAISINDNSVADIDPTKCIGCGICVDTCPNGLIHLIKDTERVVVKCNSRKKGADVRKYCVNGCIACGKCAKNCPEGAITIIDNLAVIDYDKCTGCGICKSVCPVGCIHEGSFICGSHFE